jgi:hypothetical protein
MPTVGLGIHRYSTLSEAAFSNLLLAKNWYVHYIQAFKEGHAAKSAE